MTFSAGNFMRSTDAILSPPVGVGSNGWSNFTVRVVLPASAFSPIPRGTISRVRLRMHAGPAEPLNLSKAYIGQAASSGDAYDFAATPSQLLFSASAAVLIPVGGYVDSDWISGFTWDKASPLVVSWHCSTGSTQDQTVVGAASGASSFYKSGDDAATVNATGYTTYSTNVTFGALRIEVDGF